MLSIDASQLARLDEDSHLRYEERCVDFLRQRFPELDAVSAHDAQLASVRAGIASARFIGLENEDDVVLYLYLRQLLGAGFECDPGTPAGAAMNDPALTPSQRLDLAAERAAQQLAPA